MNTHFNNSAQQDILKYSINLIFLVGSKKYFIFIFSASLGAILSPDILPSLIKPKELPVSRKIYKSAAGETSNSRNTGKQNSLGVQQLREKSLLKIILIV